MIDVNLIAFASERAPRTRIFHIDGIPAPLARPRFANGHVYDSQKDQKFLIGLKLKEQMENERLFDGPLEIDLTFYFPFPPRSSPYRKAARPGSPHIKKPDLDNLIKMVCDCAANNILYKDDCIISACYARKMYGTPGTELIIRELECLNPNR